MYTYTYICILYTYTLYCKYYKLCVNTINFLLSSIYITHISYVNFTNFAWTIYIPEFLYIAFEYT